MNNRLLLISFILLHCINPLLAQQPIAAPVVRTDVCVFGATPSGIAAAVSAAREGAKVLLIEESEHLGGMITSGMSNPDFKTFEAVGGFYRQFMLRVLMHYEAQYGKESQQVKDCFRGVWYEPKVASAIFSQMLVEYKQIEVRTGHKLSGFSVATSGEKQAKEHGRQGHCIEIYES